MSGYWVQYVLQNVMPPSFWTLTGMAFSYWRLHKKLDRHHASFKAHLERTIKGFHDES
jgi:hypothetical protein